MGFGVVHLSIRYATSPRWHLHSSSIRPTPHCSPVLGLVLLASAVFHALNLIVVPIQYLDTMVLLALYGPSSICFAYVVSFAFDDLFRPRFTLAGIHVLTALFASFAISLEVPGNGGRLALAL